MKEWQAVVSALTSAYALILSATPDNRLETLPEYRENKRQALAEVIATLSSCILIDDELVALEIQDRWVAYTSDYNANWGITDARIRADKRRSFIERFRALRANVIVAARKTP